MKFASDFKAVYNAPNEKAGLEVLADIGEKWGTEPPVQKSYQDKMHVSRRQLTVLYENPLTQYL